ncbi:hypothetical protein GGX14DRAFT_444025 [Mycena pura]|uniref:DUF6533 domain-containing protein n=1 Tax=Mycena pura TaxID=153505 RepID=A0AAD6VJ26_9AGAR|nr:hypothetical protein GGX14DRAFT_444025 [Mycena pura]
MSSTGSTLTTATQHQLNANYYFSLVSLTLLFYDYFLTLGWEVSRYWRLHLTAPSILFFVNRYGMLFGSIPVVLESVWTAESTPRKLAVCKVLQSYHQYFTVVTQIIIGVMLILRTYALYERNRRVLALMILVSSGVIGVGAWAVLSERKASDIPTLNLYIGCSTGVSSSQTIHLASAWIGMAAFDCTIFMLTLYRTLTRKAGGGGLFAVLLRDGSIYFGVMLLATIANILTFILGESFTRGLPTTFTNVISSIMISRLMLNLRDPALASMSGRLTDSIAMTTTRTHTRTGSGGVFSSVAYLSRSAPGLADGVLDPDAGVDVGDEHNYGRGRRLSLPVPDGDDVERGRN